MTSLLSAHHHLILWAFMVTLLGVVAICFVNMIRNAPLERDDEIFDEHEPLNDDYAPSPLTHARKVEIYRGLDELTEQFRKDGIDTDNVLRVKGQLGKEIFK